MAAAGVATIMRVLRNLIGKHGLARGVKIAQKLGFKNKEIKKAVSKVNINKLASPKAFMGKYPKNLPMGSNPKQRQMYRDIQRRREAEMARKQSDPRNPTNPSYAPDWRKEDPTTRIWDKYLTKKRWGTQRPEDL